jgi:hypothetical protein
VNGKTDGADSADGNGFFFEFMLENQAKSKKIGSSAFLAIFELG